MAHKKNSPDDLKRRVRKVGRYHLLLFLLPTLSILYYGWLKAPELNERADNPQRLAPLSKRGRLLDRDSKPWAFNQRGERVYPLKEAAGALVGYQLVGRNHTGLEAALQAELSPPLPPSSLAASIKQDEEIRRGERVRLEGPDVRLTLDQTLQMALYNQIKKESGAVVVADRHGHILASVSSPSFDPNEIREQWQELREDPRSPFIERVGSGLYPVLQTSGEPLLEESQAFPWLQPTPFPNYPNASSAAWIEKRLFVTPLMLLQLSYWNDPSPANPVLTLFAEPKELQFKAPEPLQISSVSSTTPNGLMIWNLDGPPFKSSPRFLASFGINRSGLHFAVVLEEDNLKSRAALHNCLETIASLYNAAQEI